MHVKCFFHFPSFGTILAQEFAANATPKILLLQTMLINLISGAVFDVRLEQEHETCSKMRRKMFSFVFDICIFGEIIGTMQARTNYTPSNIPIPPFVGAGHTSGLATPPPKMSPPHKLCSKASNNTWLNASAQHESENGIQIQRRGSFIKSALFTNSQTNI